MPEVSAPTCRQIVTLIASLLLPFTFTGVANAATVNLQIKSQVDLPVTGIPVTILRNPADGAGQAKSVLSGVTDANGRLSIDVADAGSYFVCAGSAAAELLDSCLWENSTATFTIPSGITGTAVSANVKLEGGTTLKVRIADPQGLIPTPFNPQRSGFLQLGVFSGGRFRFARLVSFDSTGLNYEIVVPIGADIHISFQAFNVRVLDSAGVTVDPSRTTVSFTTPTTLSSTVQQFSVVAGN